MEGLSSSEARDRLVRFGQNSLGDGGGRSPFSLFVSQYRNLITVILLSAGAFSFFIGENVDGGFILLVLLLNGVFGFVQEFRAERAMEALSELVLPEARVLRDGKEQIIEAREIVPGDVVILSEGSKIPADGEIVTKGVIEVDEAIFTGESLSVDKNEGDELLSGTHLVRGHGQLLVKSTGFETKLGQLASKMQVIERPKTPLSVDLDHLGKRLAFFGIGLSILLIPIGLLQGRMLSHLLLTVVSLSVAVIPEGLPLVVTIALAVGARRMVKKNSIVRKITAIETLGATSVILTDKTGTLTQNKMSVNDIYLPSASDMTLLMRGFLVGNTSKLVKNEATYEAVGDPTDGAFLTYAKENVVDFESFSEQGKLVSEKPFDPETKQIEVEWEDGEGLKNFFVRGAPEAIFERLEVNQSAKWYKVLEKYATDGYRVIAFAHGKSISSLRLIALVALHDPPRDEAKSAIQDAKTAGIKVVMVTGDNPVTAEKIGISLGLCEAQEQVVTGASVRNMSDRELIDKLSGIRVFARMKPEDKLRLVKLYQQSGHVVAVTGDGVNDSLALAEANIGVAMGQSGTDVAREASDVVITDDNLATIISAVEEGRGIYDNIVKVVTFLLRSNGSEFLLIFLGILLNLPIPLLPTQILWVNLVSDGLPALALATDRRRKGLLNERPRKIRAHIVNWRMVIFMLYLIIPFTVFLLLAYYISLQHFSVEVSRLIVFNLLVVGEMLMVFLVRGGLFPFNKFLVATVLGSLLLQFLIMFFEPLRVLFV